MFQNELRMGRPCVRLLAAALLVFAWCAMSGSARAETVRVLVLRGGVPVWIEREAPATGGMAVRSEQSADDTLARRISAAFAAQLAPPSEELKAQGVQGIAPEELEAALDVLRRTSRNIAAGRSAAP